MVATRQHHVPCVPVIRVEVTQGRDGAIVTVNGTSILTHAEQSQVYSRFFEVHWIIGVRAVGGLKTVL